MDGFHTPVIPAYKAKVDKDKKQAEKKEKKEKEKQQREREKQQKTKQKPKKGDKNQNNRSKDKTLSAIGKSTGEDVCCCIRVLTEYVKEAIKLVLCAPSSAQTGDKFGPMFCELGDVTIRLLYDAFNFIKFLVKAVLCALSVK